MWHPVRLLFCTFFLLRRRYSSGRWKHKSERGVYSECNLSHRFRPSRASHWSNARETLCRSQYASFISVLYNLRRRYGAPPRQMNKSGNVIESIATNQKERAATNTPEYKRILLFFFSNKIFSTQSKRRRRALSFSFLAISFKFSRHV